MHRREKDKTTFMTNCANFYYKAMSFDLKNVGATYQWLMNKIFKKMLILNVEVYVDDN